MLSALEPILKPSQFFRQMERAAACMVCGEKTHLSSKCKQIGLPPEGFFTGGGGGGGHQHEEDDEHCVFTSKPTSNVGEDDEHLEVVQPSFVLLVAVGASYCTTPCSQDGESQRELPMQFPSAPDSPNTPSSVAV